MKLSTTAAQLASLSTLAVAKTVYTGDVLSGYPVISSLDITDVPANAVSRFWISPAAAQGGSQYFLPIFVARGTADSLSTGRKLSISASIHGDELNGIPVVGRVFASLNETAAAGELNGTVIGMPTLNPYGNVENQRQFFSTDLNRLFPGESIAQGGSIETAYVYNIWNNVWGNTSNVDIAVDLHTLGTGSNGPLWAYADFAAPGVRRLAELAQPDIIKIDPGEPGSVETTFVDSGIPAITLEIGPAKNWNSTLIARAEAFLARLMEDLGMVGDALPGIVEVDFEGTYRGMNVSYVTTTCSGWVEMEVVPLQDVEAGEKVGTVYNSWGDVLEVLKTEVAGRVLTVATDPAVEAGEGVMDVVYNATASG